MKDRYPRFSLPRPVRLSVSTARRRAAAVKPNHATPRSTPIGCRRCLSRTRVRVSGPGCRHAGSVCCSFRASLQFREFCAAQQRARARSCGCVSKPFSPQQAGRDTAQRLDRRKILANGTENIQSSSIILPSFPSIILVCRAAPRLGAAVLRSTRRRHKVTGLLWLSLLAMPPRLGRAATAPGWSNRRPALP